MLITVADILEEKVHGKWLSSYPRKSAQEKVGGTKLSLRYGADDKEQILSTVAHEMCHRKSDPMSF